MAETSTGTPSVPRLSVRGIVKRYSGVTVLHGVSVDVAPGEVVGLVGHNGAGKSTLLRVVAGATVPDEGTVAIDGEPLTIDSPSAAIAAGVATVYQELSLLPNLTVAQNVFLGDERARAGILQRRQMLQEAAGLVESFGLPVDVDRRLGDYPVATRQMLEIAVATHRNARCLLLDEPTTSLEGDQVERFLETVRTLARERRLGILFVDHKLDELYAVGDRIVALVDGRVRIDAAVSNVPRDEVVAAIAGEDVAHPASAGPSAPVAAVAPVVAGLGGRQLVVSHLRAEGVDDVSLSAEPGRVLGIYGLVGAGRTETLRALTGLGQVEAGAVTLDGAHYRPGSPAAAQRAGVVYLTEERKHDGIVAVLDAPANVSLPVLRRYRRGGFLHRRRLRAEAVDVLTRLRVRGNLDGPVVALSGGNQQKVLLARAIAQRPRVLLLDEPTKGVDLGVKAEIHRMIRSLAHDAGLTVVLVSSEEEEICEVADDVVVMTHGRCTGVPLTDEHRTPRALRQAAWSAA